MAKGTSKKRAESLKRYLDDCKAGVDTVAAWDAHKARMLPNGKFVHPLSRIEWSDLTSCQTDYQFCREWAR